MNNPIYSATISYFEKTEAGTLLPHTETVIGSKTRVFNMINETLRSGSFESITAIISHSREEK